MSDASSSLHTKASMAYTVMLSCKFPPSASAPHSSLRRTSTSTRKHSDRLLSSLASSSDPSITHRTIRKFVSSSSKSTSLQTLSLLLSRSSPLALPIYQRISTTHWFKWTPKLAAELVAVLESNGLAFEAQTLISDSVSKLNSQKDIAHFYCELIDAASDRGLVQLVLECYARIKEMPFLGGRVFESMVRGLSLMGMPDDAEKVFDEMLHSGYRPSGFEYRMLVQGYGRLGSFNEMRRVVRRMEDARLGVDTVCANVLLSCYGDYGKISEMLAWIREMRDLGISYTFRTFNTVLNSCPNVVLMVKDVDESLPLSVDDLLEKVDGDEALLVKELMSSSVLVESLKWSDTEGELDLHGFHLASTYVIILQWMEELRCRFRDREEIVVPLEISVVCGSGKHSSIKGESPVRKLVQEMMIRLKSPLKIDRKNVGKFVAKGKAVRNWLC